jgi:7,8-dihydroneopterin aldolase/epimerase/oxygenase
MDTIAINNIRADAIIGELEWERTQRQPISCDVQLTTDLRPAGQTDSIADTIDYAAVGELIVSLMTESKFHMLEALAENITMAVLAQFHPHSVTLTLHKQAHFANAEAVAVTITRP